MTTRNDDDDDDEQKFWWKCLIWPQIVGFWKVAKLQQCAGLMVLPIWMLWFHWAITAVAVSS